MQMGYAVSAASQLKSVELDIGDRQMPVRAAVREHGALAGGVHEHNNGAGRVLWIDVKRGRHARGFEVGAHRQSRGVVAYPGDQGDIELVCREPGRRVASGAAGADQDV